MDPETEKRVQELTDEVRKLTESLKPGIPQEEWNSVKAQIDAHKDSIGGLLKSAELKQQEEELESIKASVDTLMKERRSSRQPSYKAGVDDDLDDMGNPTGAGRWLKALYEAKTQGNPEAWATVKATLADSDAGGGYVIPKNVVTSILEVATNRNIYRGLLDVIPGVRGNAVDIPVEVDDSSLQRAIGQGGEVASFGSNKDTRDFTVGNYTATLFPIARIIDVGNQFLKRSEGAAERLVRSKLGRAFALAEAHYILNGTGVSNQPTGLITALAAASASYTTTYSSGARADKIAEALGALEGRNYNATAVVMATADFWQLVTDQLGSGAGGYAVGPNAAAIDPGSPNSAIRVFGVPVLRDPAMTAGTAILGEWNAAQLFIGDEYRVDVSDEAGTRWDRNITGFRAEEEIAFNATPYVSMGMFQRITGL